MSNTSRNSAGNAAQNSSQNDDPNRTLNRTHNSPRNTSRNVNRNSKSSQSSKSSSSTKTVMSRNASREPANKDGKTNNSQPETANRSMAGTSKVDEQQTTEEENRTKNTAAAVEDIQPLVYSFRVPNNPSPGSLMHAVLPPYWLYHDHVFGVIWMLFHKDKKYVGAAQLHWCLKFLQDLKNTEGEYTGDVNVCIQAVQDELMEQYANLGLALELQESRQGERMPEDGTDGGYDSTWRSSDSNPVDVNIKESEINLIESEMPTEQGRVDNVGANLLQAKIPMREGEAITENYWTSLHGDTAMWSLRETGGDASRRNKCDSMTVYRPLGLHMNQVAFSLTYNEMASRGQRPYTEQVPLEQIYRAGPCGTNAVPSIPEIVQVLVTDESAPQPSTDGAGNEELVSFLDESRRAHIDRIKREVQQLQAVEKFMEGVSKSGFKAYVSNDLANRLDKVNSKNVVREVQHALK